MSLIFIVNSAVLYRILYVAVQIFSSWCTVDLPCMVDSHGGIAGFCAVMDLRSGEKLQCSEECCRGGEERSRVEQ